MSSFTQNKKGEVIIMRINKKFMAMFIGITLAMSSTAFAAETTDAKLGTDFMSVNGTTTS